jgi:hypothetical protein
MTRRVWALALGLAAVAAIGAAQSRVYRIELASGGMLWADEQPLISGDQLVFRPHQSSSMQSLRRTDVKRIVAVATAPTAPAMKPGQAIDIGVTGPGARGGRSGAAAPAAASTALRPGEGKGGSALFNPDRTYRPDWDGKMVPGSTMGFPNSPNDYKEGVTIARPSAGAVQTSPGDVPRAPQ